jgi:putative mRNA 3-end processing factor
VKGYACLTVEAYSVASLNKVYESAIIRGRLLRVGLRHTPTRAVWQTILVSSDKERKLCGVLLKADVTSSGAILLGRHVACDAHEKTRPLRVVTHAHADHMNGLLQSLKNCKTVLMTPATRDLIDILKGPTCLQRGNVKAVEYGRPWLFDGEQLTLHKVDHILGAAQALVEDADGTRILYTGDFRLADTPVIPSDYLVIEATYGNPWRRRDFEHEARHMLVSTVERGLKQGPVYVFGYHGKLQEVMQILHDAKIKAPFVMPEKILKITQVHQKHGLQINRPLFPAQHPMQSTLEGSASYVAFYHMNSRRKVGLDKFKVCVSGWEFDLPCRRTGEREFVVALSDHSDFKGLLEYVRQSKPKLVIADNYRAGDAYSLSRQIQRQLGIEAKPLPA